METNISHPIVNSPNQPQTISRVEGGYLVIAESLKLLNKNKSMVLFPIFSALASVAVVVICVLAFLFFGDAQYAPSNGTAAQIVLYGSYFIFYLVTTFVVTFFQAGLVVAINEQINGKKISFSEAMGRAGKRAGKILTWSLTWATVGVVIDFFQNKTKLAGKIAASIFGVAWGLATFFIVPVLVLENHPMDESLKRSAEIFRKKWGETIIANFAASLYFVLLWAVGLVLFLSYLFLAEPAVTLIILATALFVVFSAVITIVYSTVEGIYRVVLYEYAANDKIVDGFPQGLVLGAIKK